MKKLLLIALIWHLSISNVFHAQDFETGFSKPVASVSSLANYTNSPVSYATGVPDISFPLASLPTNSSAVSAGINLSYHPKNLLSNEKASDVGLGWSLLGSNGVISREIIKGLDEKYSDASSPGYFKNEFDDIYYYNIAGYNGKFRILRNTQDDTFQLIKLTPSNLKIEYVRNSNNATLIFDSFKITDDRGFIYLFQNYSVSEYKEGSYGREYRSAFFLTKVYDHLMQEVIAFDYQVDTYTSISAPLRTFQNCKLKKIRSKDNGSVEFNYSYEAAFRKSMNDPYQVNSILVKNNTGNLLSKVEFLYGYISFTNPGSYGDNIAKRILSKITKYGSDPNKYEVTEFDYNMAGSETDYGAMPNRYKDYFLCTSNSNEIENPQYFPVGSLKTVKLSTGGKIDYNFEANEYFYDKSTVNYAADLGLTGFVDPQVQYVKDLHSANFNTHVSKTYTFTVSGSASVTKAVYVQFVVEEIEPYDPMLGIGDDSPPTLYYEIPDANYGDGLTGVMCATTDNSISASKFQLTGGTHTLKINTTTAGRGHFEIYEMAVIPGPYRNAMVSSGLGIRIRDIKYFDKLSTQTPVKIERFRYDSFADNNNSSGELREEGGAPGEPSQAVIYKNVKVLNGDNGGYTQYYYKTPSSYPLQPNPQGYGYWPNINITRGGLLEKKEVYDATNKLLASENYDYTISEMNIPKYIPFESGNFETRTAYIKEQRIASKVFDMNGRSVTTNSETVRSAEDFNVIKESVTNSDGSINEKNYQYAREKNNTALMAANILSTPLQTQVIKNGTLVSKNEVLFNNTSQLYPTSVLVYTPDNMSNSYTGIRYDIYDEKGHVVQYSVTPDAAGNATPATIIYGYNKTVPIAKIEGAKLSDISQNLIDAIVTASDEDANAVAANAQAKENALLAQLEIFKNHSSLSAFSITAYTYDPMIGVTNVLPPNGIREKYLYDSFGRLQKVIDTNGRTLKEYQYNYKQ